VPMDEPVPYALTDLAHRQRLANLTEQMAYVEQVSMDLFLYVRAVDGLPDWDEWKLIREQVAELVNQYGLRSPDR